MGCNPSTPADRVAPNEGESEKALGRLLGGIHITGGEAACAKALNVVSAFFAAKFNGRAPTKPIDLTHLITAERRVDPELIKQLESASVAKKTVSAVKSGLETLHERAVPKLGVGTINLHMRCPDTQPLKVAYDHGVRHFPFVDPFPPMAKPNPVEEYGNDLRECDLSDVVMSSATLPFGPAGMTAEMVKGSVRKSFDAFVKTIGPLKTGYGQPVLDCYMCFFPFLVAMPNKDPMVDVKTFGEIWEEMEALVDEGLVRSLGVSNLTVHQLDMLLKTAKHRPCLVQQERHILNQVPEFKAYCDEKKLALVAAVPLAVGEVLDSKHLVHDEMTPAQAALHWNIKSNVSVIPGADTIEQLIENCATMSKLHLPAIKPPNPPNKLRKVYPVWPPCAGLFLETGTKADTGTFVKDERGYLKCVKEVKTEAAASPMKAELNAAEKALLDEVNTVVSNITQDIKSHAAMRGIIDQALSDLAAAEAAGGDQGTTPSPLKRADTAHTFVARTSGNLTRMMVTSFTTFLAAGKIPRRSCNDDTLEHMHVDALPEDAKVLFFSQRWLTPKGDPASPDDAEGTKYKAVVAATHAWAELKGVATENIYLWIDYASVEQDDVLELTRGVSSLGLYVASCDAFITIEHDSYFDRGWCLMECVYADASKVPRFLMTAAGELKPMVAEDRVELKRPHQGSFTVESDRDFMRNLEAAAQSISSQMERGMKIGLYATE